jgi:hypothetical protein
MQRLLLLVALLFHPSFSLRAQNESAEVDVPAEAQFFNAGELDILLGPIALYPDPLLSALLPAATQPTEIVIAARFVANGGDSQNIDSQSWSDSVKALAYYPDVLRWMDENLEWTRQLGEAFLAQPEDVIAAIQRLREYARALGNLVSNAQQIVEFEDNNIDINPVDPDFVFLPVYEPEIVYTQPAAAYIGPLVTFGNGKRAGAWLKHDWDWKNRRVVTWSKDHARPRTWWSQSRKDRFQNSSHFQEWCPRPQKGQYQSKWWTQRRQQSSQSGRAQGRPAGTASAPSVSRAGAGQPSIAR